MNYSKDLYSFIAENDQDRKVREMGAWNDHRGNLSGPYQDHSIRCYAYVVKDGFCLRANTLSSYCELNRQASCSLNIPVQEITLLRTFFFVLGYQEMEFSVPRRRANRIFKQSTGLF